MVWEKTQLPIAINFSSVLQQLAILKSILFKKFQENSIIKSKMSDSSFLIILVKPNCQLIYTLNVYFCWQ
ncbi:unnamed protein product [Blepharisma stoltei]|uniref:Uncharacterized protein n=1 Tax=Blepharisma stoltei TaxID=1481888 RepID=A0AAU9ILL1_9CILI|nr:unnamed protein product [Blepharisma stoltei]